MINTIWLAFNIVVLLFVAVFIGLLIADTLKGNKGTGGI
jgi:hypothetical protein